ncbi:hypothetical protein [Allorhizobium taibaishanense]|uniref:Uncharacterized protein n=1 Tax=Allorhizobium taibaishanense TaxID=887144 RepID=A0A7W6HMG9_9HYPH|nr:hypothetical protein [Allorhizobium taibaishanense]MBB4007841.1 hypothetical protein [Allorhizobium taibaishanense]
MFSATISQNPSPNTLTRAAIAAHPRFPAIEREIAWHLISIHRKSPRLSRLKACHRKWLMSQSMYALALQRRPDDPSSGLTASRFMEVAMQLGAASRNTASAFLAELSAYKFIEEIENPADRRMRILIPTPASESAMISWFMGHLDCLDRLDDGSRVALANANSEIFKVAQPLIAHALVADPDWRNPRDTIAPFLNSDMGGMVLHGMISQIPDQPDTDGVYRLGPVSLASLGEAYLLSITNLKRMFKKAQDDGLLGWELPRRRGSLWLSERFVVDYFHWQSTKFEAVNTGFWTAVERVGITVTEPVAAAAKTAAASGSAAADKERAELKVIS